tara:strand:+ start:486 stop:1097 length:612 start_codon:yes stop_codon:yes gene_type:complete
MVLALYTPIDLPAMTVDRQEFIEWHEANRKRNANNIGHSTKDFIAPWLVSFAYKKDSGWNDSLLKVIPNLKNIVENYLPFTNITYINFLEQKIPCMLHRDRTSQTTINSNDQPDSYKAFMVYDKPLMYFQKDKDIEDRLYIKHPNNLTKWFAVNNYDALHAADLPTDPDRKIIMTISGELDIVKHREILKRSLEKFKDYIITL